MALKEDAPPPQGGQLGWVLAVPPPPVAARRRHPPPSPPLVRAALLAPGQQTCTCTLRRAFSRDGAPLEACGSRQMFRMLCVLCSLSAPISTRCALYPAFCNPLTALCVPVR